MCGVWAVVKRFLVAAVLITAMWLVAVFALNQSVFSPGGYVLSYLDALERGDFGEAAARAGLSEVPVVFPDVTALLTETSIGATLAIDDDEMVVQTRYLLDGIPGEALFTLTRLPRVLGLFDRWEFRDIPQGEIIARVLGSNELTINGVTLLESDTENGVALLYPARYTVSWSSGWLETDSVELALEGTAANTVRLVASPTPELVAQATQATTAYLQSCLDQAVLQPTGCPFGLTITDRVSGEVVWEVSTPPRIVLAMLDDETTWQVSALGGEVTVNVSVQSLFDGTVSEVVETQTIDVTGLIDALDSDRPRFIVE